MLRLAAGGLSNGKFSIAVIKILNYWHGVQQRYHDAKCGDNRHFDCVFFNLQK